MKILFVCTGNTCRSPMAAALLKDELPSVEVRSAGIFATHGAPASPNAVHVLNEHSIPINHQSEPVTAELLGWADIVLTMTSQHKQILMENNPIHSEKYFTLKEYSTSDEHNLDISDPYGGDVAVYRETRDEIANSIKRLLHKLNHKERGSHGE